MTLRLHVLLIPLCALLLSSCADIVTSCAPEPGVTPICGVQMPEDLAALPNEGGLLIGEMGNMGHLAGMLTWYQPDSDSGFIRLVDSTSITTGASDENWGQPDCPVPDQLSPHGIHLSQRGEELQLLVVNHASREHILFYAVTPSTDGTSPPGLAWRGCVQFPEYAVLNDVAALPDGGFAVTHMYNRENEMLAQMKSMLGLNKGHVWRWIPGQDISVMANTRARMPNGIEVAADGKSVWINNYLEGEVRQLDVATEAILSTIAVPNIDNSAWLPDGRLLIASHLSPITMAPCFGLTEGSCGSGYQLVAADTTTGETEIIFKREKGGVFGPATVAIPYRGALYAGSFSGDRMAKIDTP
jgi:hypothetical protein